MREDRRKAWRLIVGGMMAVLAGLAAWLGIGCEGSGVEGHFRVGDPPAVVPAELDDRS
jgi:hypothetical protein